jgi:hypothetical protein
MASPCVSVAFRVAPAPLTRHGQQVRHGMRLPLARSNANATYLLPQDLRILVCRLVVAKHGTSGRAASQFGLTPGAEFIPLGQTNRCSCREWRERL